MTNQTDTTSQASANPAASQRGQGKVEKTQDSTVFVLPEPMQRLELAEQFYNELNESVEVLSDMVEQHGPRTLSDLFHLHASIINNGFIDAWPDSAVLDVVSQLPSADRWLEYASVYDECGCQKESIFSTLQDCKMPIIEMKSISPSMVESMHDETKASAMQLVKVQNAIDLALPSENGRDYECGFKDALQSMCLALAEKLDANALQVVINTALDAYGNNVDLDVDDSPSLGM